MTDDEKRKYPRVALNVEDGYFGNFILPDQSRLVGSIVNLSARGVNFSIPAPKQEQISHGVLLLLKDIVGAAHLAFLEDVKAEVRWVRTVDNSDLFSVGCLFFDISDSVLDQMVRFVDGERMVRGQYD